MWSLIMLRRPPRSTLFPCATLFRADRGPGWHLLLCAGLAGLTAAPWFTALLMPDILAPALVLALFLLGFAEDRLGRAERSEEHTSELQSRQYLVCRLLLEKKHQSASAVFLQALIPRSSSFLPSRLFFVPFRRPAKLSCSAF